MATEPERKIEQLLRAYAQKRRDEAGEQFALHSANRRLLQAEVAKLRDNSGQASASWLQIFSQVWVRAGLAFSILLMLGVVLWVMHPWERVNQQMAKSTPSKALEARSKDTLGRAPAKDQERVASSPAPATPAPAPAKEISLADGAQNAPVDNLKSSSLEKRKNLREEQPKAEIGDRAKLESLSKGVAESPARSAGTAGLAAAGEQKKADLPALTTAPAPAPAQPPTTVQQDYFFRQQAKTRDEAQAAPTTPTESSPALAQADKSQQSQPAAPAAPLLGGRMGGYGGGGFGGGNYRANFGEVEKPPADEKRDADTVNQLAAGQGPTAAGAQDAAAGARLRQPLSFGTPAPRNQETASQALGQTNALFAQSQMGREAERRLTENEALQRPSSAIAAKAPAAKPALTLAPAQSSREQFAALPGMGSGSPAALSSFVLERSGNQVRLIDADGSIYEGQLLVQVGDEVPPALKQRVDSATKGIAKDSPKLGVEVTRRARMATTSPAVSFRASGMNRTLKQQIEIQATIGSPAALPAPQGTLVGGVTAGRAFPARGYASSPAATTPPPPAAPSVVPPGPQQAGSRSTLSSAPASNTVLLQGTATTATGQQIPIQAARISATK